MSGNPGLKVRFFALVAAASLAAPFTPASSRADEFGYYDCYDVGYDRDEVHDDWFYDYYEERRECAGRNNELGYEDYEERDDLFSWEEDGLFG